jgi:hypothetical protein
METIIDSHRATGAGHTFHLARVQSLLRPGVFGGATNRIPFNAERCYSDRVRGYVTVILPGGAISTARAFEALCASEVPQSTLAHAMLGDATYWFRCSPAHLRPNDMPGYRAYFLHEGKWLFFYTEGATLPFGAVVNYSKCVFDACGSTAQTAAPVARKAMTRATVQFNESPALDEQFA